MPLGSPRVEWSEFTLARSSSSSSCRVRNMWLHRARLEFLDCQKIKKWGFTKFNADDLIGDMLVARVRWLPVKCIPTCVLLNKWWLCTEEGFNCAHYLPHQWYSLINLTSSYKKAHLELCAYVCSTSCLHILTAERWETFTELYYCLNSISKRIQYIFLLKIWVNPQKPSKLCSSLGLTCNQDLTWKQQGQYCCFWPSLTPTHMHT